MSRSYKKSPVYTDRDSGKYWKKIGNKRVRRNKITLPKGKKYKKLYNSWEIHDYISRWDKYQALTRYYKYKEIYDDDYKSEKDYLNKYWKKYYFRK